MAFTVTILIIVSGCDSQSELGNNNGPQDKPTTYQGPSSLSVPVGLEFFFSDTVSDANGLKPANITVDLDDGSNAILTSQSAISVRFEFSYTPATAEDDVTVIVSGKDDDGFSITTRTITLDATAPIDTPGGVVDVTHPIGIAGRTTELNIHGFDPDGLVSGFIEADGQRFDQFFSDISGNLVASVLVTSAGVNYTGGFTDKLGNTTGFVGAIDVLGRANVQILFREFFSKDAGSGSIEFILDDPNLSWDTTFVANASGWAEWDVPLGRHIVTLHPPVDASPLIRLRVTPDMLKDQDAHWIERGNYVGVAGAIEANSSHTYAVSGAGQLPFILDINADVRSIVEYVADRDYVDSMKQQLDRDQLILFDISKPVNFVVYAGNPACGVSFDGLSACSDGGAKPPGNIATLTQLDNHEKWYNHNLALLENVVLGGNPYNMQRFIADEHNISQYIDDFVPTSIQGSSNVSLVYFKTGEGLDFRSYQVWVGFFAMKFSAAVIPNNSLGFIAHEENDSFGQTFKNGREPNCSVRVVAASATLPDCPPIPEDRVQYDYDDRFVQIATAFGTFAQRQMNPVDDRRGFNLKVWSKR